MSLKRKRSADASSTTTTTTLLSSFSPSPPSSMDLDTTPQPAQIWSWNRRKPFASDLGSRTRKRFRDHRPDERVVYENTISKLFAAQRQHPHAQPVPSQPQAPPPPPPPGTAVPGSVQKSTLHAFWRLPQSLPHHQPHASPPSHSHGPGGIVVRTPASATEDAQAGTCEDCDGALPWSDAMLVDSDGPEAAGEFACCGCGRRVCDLCAVVGDERRCLGCAMGGG